jgi:hypothetical protein
LLITTARNKLSILMESSHRDHLLHTWNSAVAPILDEIQRIQITYSSPPDILSTVARGYVCKNCGLTSIVNQPRSPAIQQMLEFVHTINFGGAIYRSYRSNSRITTSNPAYLSRYCSYRPTPYIASLFASLSFNWYQAHVHACSGCRITKDLKLLK